MRAQPPQSRAALTRIAASFRALSEPTRLAILQELKQGAMTVGELVQALKLSQPAVSKQLTVLFQAGFLAREPRGNHVFYRIQDPMVLKLCDLVCKGLNRQAESAPVYLI